MSGAKLRGLRLFRFSESGSVSDHRFVLARVGATPCPRAAVLGWGARRFDFGGDQSSLVMVPMT